MKPSSHPGSGPSSRQSVARALPPPGARIHFFLTCLCDAIYSETARAAVRCIEAVGYKVDFDARQTCCGQPAYNSGDPAAARIVARNTLKALAGARAIVVPSGSCAAMLHQGYLQLFQGFPEYSRAIGISSRVWEFSEFLEMATRKGGWPGRLRRVAALHRSCHMREMPSPEAPARLLERVEGLTLRAIRDPEQCCGFGGTFAVSFPWISQEIGKAKLQAFYESGAQEIVSTDMGCLMSLSGLARRMRGNAPPWLNRPLPMRHIAQILAESLGEGVS